MVSGQRAERGEVGGLCRAPTRSLRSHLLASEARFDARGLRLTELIACWCQAALAGSKRCTARLVVG